MAVSALLVYFYGKIIGQVERFATITGKAYRAKVIDLGAWRYTALALFAGYFLITVVLPFLILLWASLLPFYQPPSVGRWKISPWTTFARSGNCPKSDSPCAIQ